jgi:hypothetical protein
MSKKDVDFVPECLIFEVCQPQQAKKVFENNMCVSTALPCRISSYKEGGRTILATLKPTILLAMFNMPQPEVVAQEVEETYDVIVTMPPSGSYEFRATAHDGSGQAALWLGAGPFHDAPDIPYPNRYFGMGGLSLKRVLALSPGGSMGIPGNDVRDDKFDQPGRKGLKGMRGTGGVNEIGHGAMPRCAHHTK